MQENPIRVLLIDDDHDDFQLTRAQLDEIHGRKFDLEWAKTYEAGVEALCRKEHDVCLLDYRLGGRTGLELLHQQKDHDGQAPIIFLTGQSDREVDFQAMKAGAADFLIKGEIDAQLLERSIRYALERHRTAVTLREAHDELEERVVARTRELSQANVLLAEADRRKDEFLAMLAHELRNPLAPLAAAVHFMRLRGMGHADLENARGVIERQVQHLARLVDDLLDVARIMRGKIQLRLERVDLRSALAAAVETSKPLFDAHKHQLHVALPLEPLELQGDATRLAQIFSNLLNNAAKFTHEAGQIWLQAELPRDQTPATEVLVRVRDTGVGIAAELLPRIFDLFAQADATLDRSSGGLGIGLTVVRRLVELHGGRVQALSAGPTHGSEFIVRLPLAAPLSSPKPNDGANAAPLPARRILLVDDNIDTTEMLAKLLQLDGHIVGTANDGESALRMAASFQPEIILLDIGLPDLSGYEVAKQIRAQPAFQNVLLVAVTGYGRDQDRGRSRAAGFHHHLIKPLTPKMLAILLGDPSKLDIERLAE